MTNGLIPVLLSRLVWRGLMANSKEAIRSCSVTPLHLFLPSLPSIPSLYTLLVQIGDKYGFTKTKQILDYLEVEHLDRCWRPLDTLVLAFIQV